VTASRRHGPALVVIVLALAAVGCNETAPVAPPPTPAASTPAVRPFTLARIPFSNPSAMMQAHQPVLDGLATALGCGSAYMITAPDYQGVLQLLVDGKVDAAWLGTVAYVQARMGGVAIEPLVCPLRRGTHSYRGAIICRAEKPYQKLADLKGARMAFVEPSSASGYLFPKAMLVAAGLRVPGDVLSREHGEVDFLGKHDTVVVAVYLGNYDAGAVYDGAIENVFRATPEKAAEMRVLSRTATIFNEPIVVRADMDRARKEAIKQAFLSVRFTEDASPEEMGGLQGFESVDASSYDGVIAALRRR